MSILYRQAKLEDIAEVLTLHYRYQVDSINEEDKQDGFITTPFTEQQMVELIEREDGLFLALNEQHTIIGYAMAASWKYWQRWPMFAHMIKGLPNLTYQGHRLSIDNSYQYGPICVDKSVRGEGVFEGLFEYALAGMAKRFKVLITFINIINPRSYAAHTKKARLDVIQEFEYNSNHYYELACLTARD